jgi:hypothetical protein
MSLEWVNHTGGISDDYCQSILVDSVGHVFVAGTFRDTIDVDPGQGILNFGSPAGKNSFIQKLDADGNLLWARHIEGASASGIGSIALDNLGNIYAAGGFSGTVDFDPGSGVSALTSPWYTSIFVAKYDQNGDLVWVKSTHGAAYNGSNSVATDDFGNVYTTGHFTGVADFDPDIGVYNLTSAGSPDVFVQKLSPDGDFMWARRMGGTFNDYGHEILVDNQGNVVVSGDFSLTLDLDTAAGVASITSNGDQDIFLLKLDANGNLIWLKQIGGNGDDRSLKIAVNATGDIYNVGYFNDSVDFDPGLATNTLSSAGGQDAYIQKLNADGDLLWVQQIGGNSADWGTAVTIDSDENVYLSGFFSGTVDFDSGVSNNVLVSGGLSDIYIQKLDDNGNLIWLEQISGTANDIPNDIEVDNSNHVYLCGSFYGVTDFDPGANTTVFSAVGSSDIFVAKLAPCVANGIDYQTACSSYQWVDGVTYTNSNSTAIFNIVAGAASGCDSLATLDLTIISNYAGSETISICNGDSVLINQDYQSAEGNYSNSYISMDACDSTVVTTLIFMDPNSCINAVHQLSTSNYYIYPNPTKGNLTIRFDEIQQELTLRIFAITGQLLENRNFRNSNVLDLELNKPRGVYFLEIVDINGNTKVIRVVKE